MSLSEALANYEPEAETPAASTPAASSDAGEPGATAATPDTAPAATSATTPPALDAKRAPSVVEGDLFSDAALATPEGITAARTELQTQKESLRTDRQRLDSKASKFEQTKNRWVAERNAFQAEKQQLVANLNLLRTGSAEQRMTILSQLTGIAGHELVRDLNLTILKKGKAPDKVAELEATVKELQTRLAKQDEEQTNAKVEREAEAKYRAELPTVFKSPECAKEFPSLAAYALDPQYPGNLAEVVDYVVKIRQDYFRQTGHPLAEELAFLQVEHQLRRIPAAAPPPAAVAPATQAPSPPARTPPVAPATGQSLTASDVTDSLSRREMSEEESIEAIANDAEAMAVLRRMGLVRN